MGLVFVPRYDLRFDTDAGSDITWEVDILRSYDDNDPIPSWTTEPVRDLIGSADPLTISYEKDYEIYKPIQGSTATLNLIVTEAGQYEDFSTGAPFEWQLRVRYRDAANVLQDYWCGFFNPVDSNEQVGTFPFERSFTAVDGLGELEQATFSSTATPSADSQVSMFQTGIVPALAQTGLGLDIYVDSGIMNGTNDALTTATVSSFAIYKDLEGSGSFFTYKEIIEGWLPAFNCKITQANGRWYIYNGSILSNETTWETYSSAGVKGADVTENLLQTVDETTDKTLTPVGRDLKVIFRREAGSVECRVIDLVEREFAINGNFENGDTAWTVNSPASIDEDLGVARIVQNYFTLNSLWANPQITNSVGYPVDRIADIEVKFDWQATKIFEDSVSMYWEVYCEFDPEPVEELDLPTGYNTAAYQAQYNSTWQSWNYVSNQNISRLYWNEEKKQWSTLPGPQNRIGQNTAELNEWANVSKTFRNPTTFYNGFGGIGAGNLRFFVRFYPLRSRDGSNWDGASTSRVAISIDNVSVKNMFDSSDIDPTFERVQADYTQTISYEPRFASSISPAILQKISPNEFTRTGPGLIFDTEATLEQIVTQQQLNDFSTRFKYYEGKFINNTHNPLTNINKIFLNWPTENYVETAAGIMNGGTFSAKRNIWNTSFYIPNQAFDVLSTYHEENVDLVPMQFPGRSEAVVYTLALKVATVDGDANPLPNGLVPDVPFIQVTGVPGTVVNDRINLLTLAGYEPVISSVELLDDMVTPIPENIEFGAIQDIGNNLEIPIQITLPEESEFEELHITAECQARLDGNTDFDLTWNVGPVLNANGVVIQNLGNGRGPIGGFGLLQAVITPLTGETLDATSFSTSGLPAGVNSVTFTQLGTSVFAYASVTFQPTAATGIITVVGNAPTALPSGVSTSTLTFDFTEMINNAFTIADIAFSGVVGTRSELLLPVYAADGYELDHDNFSVNITDSGGAVPSFITMFDAIGGGENVSIPLSVTWPAADETINVLINGVATEIGAETVDVTVNFTNNIANSTLTDATEVFTLPPGTKLGYTNSITTVDGFQFAAAPTAVSDNTTVFTSPEINGLGSIYNLNSTITAPDTDTTVTVTLGGAVELEPFRFIVDQDDSGLSNASVNYTSINQPFGFSDEGTVFTRNYSVAGVGNWAFQSTDLLTVTPGANISVTTPSFSGGVWSFVATFTYPTEASGFYADPHEFYSDLTISGTPSATDPLDDLIEVVLNFTDSVDDGAPSVPSVTLSGVQGSTTTYYSITVPSAGFRVQAGNITTTDTSGITTILADQTRGLTVVTPIEVVFPTNNTSVTLTVDGDAIAVGVPTFDYSLTVSSPSANVSLPDWDSPNVFTGVTGQVIESNIFVQSNPGYKVETAALTGSLPSNVTLGAATIQGDGAVVPISVTITGANQTGNLVLATSVAQEPYLLTVNLSETLPLAHLTQTSFTQRFGPDDYGTTHSFGQVSITPNEGERGFVNAGSATFPTITGLNFNNPLISDGAITFELTADIPDPSDGDLSYTANIEAGIPPTIQATTASIRALTAGISSAGGNAVFEVVSNGLFNLSIQLSGSGVDAALSGANDDTGSFSISTTSGLLTLTGGYSPTNGIGGTTLVDLEVGQEPFYLNPAGNTGLSASYFVPGPGYELIVHSRNPDGSDGAELDRASVLQSDTYGGRSYTVPNTWTANDPTLLNITTAKPNWVFYR